MHTRDVIFQMRMKLWERQRLHTFAQRHGLTLTGLVCRALEAAERGEFDLTPPAQQMSVSEEIRASRQRALAHDERKRLEREGAAHYFAK